MARALAMAERARQHAQQAPSQSPQQGSSGGDISTTLLYRSRVPQVYRSAEWGKVRSPAVREWTVGLAARTQRRSDPVPPNWNLLGHGMLILGPIGTGKSSAAGLCSMEAMRLGKSVRWSYVPDLVDRLMSSPRERREEIQHQSIVDLLVWDDVGVRDMAEWEIGYLDQIVEARYKKRKPMIVTSNWAASDLRGDPRLARMVDRWRERVCSNVVILGGESMRGSGTNGGVR